MTIYYSKAKMGFYHDSIHNQIPMDRVAITDEHHAELMRAQSEGKVIVPGEDGFPVAVVPETEPLTPLRQLAGLEAEITPRRLREAVLGTDGGWLKAQEAKIAALRKKLR